MKNSKSNLEHNALCVLHVQVSFNDSNLSIDYDNS
jgi:hypothetical protein